MSLIALLTVAFSWELSITAATIWAPRLLEWAGSISKTGWGQCLEFPSVFWHHCLGDGKGIRPRKPCTTFPQRFSSGTNAGWTTTTATTTTTTATATTTTVVYGPLSESTWMRWYQKKHSPTHISWSLSHLHQLLPSTMIHSILPVQFTCSTIFLHDLFPNVIRSTTWSGAIHFILHTFLCPISVFFSQHMPIPSQPVLL